MSREVVQQALEALEAYQHNGSVQLFDVAITALRQALEQQPAEWEHLKEFGYAPGNYMMTCRGCNKEVIDVDKRALQCRACAEAMYAKKQQPAGEPVAWQVHPFDYGIGHEGVYARTDRPEQVEMWKRKGWTVQPLYTRPQTAAWVGLTDEEILAEIPVTTSRPATSFARAIEAKLKEKNGG